MLYDVEAVLIAVGITTGIVLALTVFAFQVSDLEFMVFSIDIEIHNLDFMLMTMFRLSGTSQRWAGSWCAC